MNACELIEPRAAATDARRANRKLWEEYRRHHSPDAENALAQTYLPLVRSIMGRLAMTLPDHVDQDDLNSAGLVGLLQAIRNYNPGSGSSFETYARMRIRGAMLDELRRMDWVPRTIHEKARRIQEVVGQLEQKLGRSPSGREMADALNISVDAYAELLDEIRPAAFVCLDSPGPADGNESDSLYDVVADPTDNNPVDHVSQRELQGIILNRVRNLPEMQRKVLALYYGEDLHLREIAKVFGLTESRICQIHSQAIRAIRTWLQRYEAGVPGVAAAQ